MNIVIKRLFTKGEYTHGSLTIDGTKICSTLENANALVPSGDYQISLIKCKHHSRKMPVLLPQPSIHHIELGFIMWLTNPLQNALVKLSL